MASNIDLHMHSTASDGSVDPAHLPMAVQEAGIHAFALTDHDSIDGVFEVEKNLLGGQLFFRGIEFSCRTPAGKCHILGYCYDHEDSLFQKALAAMKKIRFDKLESRLDYLKEAYGFFFDQEDVDALHALPSPGKPHLALLLKKYGYVSSKDEAFQKYLKKFPKSPSRIEGKIAVEAILSAGGVPVWAHPMFGEGETPLTEAEFSDQLHLLKSYGIQGLECFYSRYDAPLRSFLVESASQNGLLISGGSDYHGTNKNIPLGTLGIEAPSPAASQLTILEKLEGRGRRG